MVAVSERLRDVGRRIISPLEDDSRKRELAKARRIALTGTILPEDRAQFKQDKIASLIFDRAKVMGIQMFPLLSAFFDKNLESNIKAIDEMPVTEVNKRLVLASVETIAESNK